MAVVKYILPTQPTRAEGGIVPYKNGSQICWRSRAYPKHVWSNAHAYNMGLIPELSIFWESPMTDAQRIAWGAYAFATPLTDAWSAPRYIKGYAHFMRSNRPRLQQSLPLIFDGPTTPGLPTYTLPTFTLAPDNTTVSVSFDNTDAWANDIDGHMMLWQTRPCSPTLNRPIEVFTPLGVISGALIPPTSPVTFPSAMELPTTPSSCFIRSSIALGDGRLSG